MTLRPYATRWGFCPIILIFDIQDHAFTFAGFAKAVSSGVIARRHPTLFVEWSAVEKPSVDTRRLHPYPYWRWIGAE